MKINTAASGHGDLTITGDHWWAYPNGKELKCLEQAMYILKNNIKGMKPCNKRFKELPGGRSFDDILNDDDVWISYDSRKTVDWYGITNFVGGKEISISQETFDKGRWFVAGTLVHEMAHVNGAPVTTGDADNTLLYCGVKSAYEGAIGMRQSGTSDTRLA
jgi:hypothetical protein